MIPTDVIVETATAQPFRLMYHTNGDETISHPVSQRDLGAANNVGFCLSFDQSAEWTLKQSTYWETNYYYTDYLSYEIIEWIN